MSFSGRIHVAWVNVNEPSCFEDPVMGSMYLQPGHFPVEATFENGKPADGSANVVLSGVTDDGETSFGRVYRVEHSENARDLLQSMERYPSVEIGWMPFIDQNNDFEIDENLFSHPVQKAHEHMPLGLKNAAKTDAYLTI